MNRIILALSTSISVFFALSAPGFCQAEDWIFADGFEFCACDDGLACTQDFCVGLDACEAHTYPTFCLIEEVCWPRGQASAGNPCLVCDPATAQDSWTAKYGLACNDGDPCTSGDTCSGGTCSGSPTPDQFEPNNTFESFTHLGTTDDSSDWPEDTFTASLYPRSDVDWFRFSEQDVSDIYEPSPKVSLSNIPTGVNYDLCAYYQCLDPGDGEDVDCFSGNTASTYNGHPGCCSRRSGTTSEVIQFRPHCDNGLLTPNDDTGNVLIRINRVSGTQTCALYHVEWGDD
jgi:hypothetical protein